MQLDVPISVLDYLDLPDSSNRLGGRSVFRRYATARDLFWGNTYSDLVAGLSSSGELAFCDGAFRSCRGVQLADRNLFSPGIELSSLDPGTVEWLQRAVEESKWASVESLDDRELLLMQPGSTPVREGNSLQFVFGGQFLTIPANVQADVEIVMELAGPKGGAVTFSHDLILDRRQQYVRTGRLGVGQVVRIRYSVVSQVAYEQVELRFWVEAVNMSGLEVVTKTARIRMSSSRSPRLKYGLTEYEFQKTGMRE